MSYGLPGNQYAHAHMSMQTIQFWVQQTMQFCVKMSAMVTKVAELAYKNHYTCRTCTQPLFLHVDSVEGVDYHHQYTTCQHLSMRYMGHGI